MLHLSLEASMKTRFAGLAGLSFIAIFGASGVVSAAELDCTAFLTGTWAGRGEVVMFGSRNEVDNTYSFNADQSFRTINRYRSAGSEWSEQDVSGEWSAVAGTDPGSCSVTMETSGDGMTASTTSTYTRIDNDRFLTMGFQMERVEQNGGGG
jgi:hypothetical protein